MCSPRSVAGARARSRAALLALLPLPALCPAQATFLGLGHADAAAPGSGALALSADGSVVAGFALYRGACPGLDIGPVASTWTAAGGWTMLPGACSTCGSLGGSVATGLSADGGRAAGHGGCGPDKWFAFLAGGPGVLPDAPGAEDCSGETAGLSPDGKTAAVSWWVNGCDGGPHAGAWTSGDGSFAFTDAAGHAISGHSWAAADDGSVVGSAQWIGTTYPWRAFRWTKGKGVELLALLPSDENGEALGASPDGRFAVGWSGNDFPDSAVRWTTAGRVQKLGFRGVASAIAADGNLVAGDSTKGATLWNPRDGGRPIAVILLDDYGISTTGWSLDHASAITHDGRTVVGYGIDPDGHDQAWMVTLPAFCHPDCNRDQTLNINDFICFQAKWRARLVYGDYNNDGLWNINDFIAFQAGWRTGCP